MNIREISSSRRSSEVIVEPTRKTGRKRLFVIITLVLLLLFGFFSFRHAHAGTKGETISSGYSGYCLDNYRDRDAPGNTVDIWSCDDQAAQDWTVGLTSIQKTDNLCLNAESETNIDLATCDQSSSQVWLPYGNQIYSPLFSKCLTSASPHNPQLTLETCIRPGTDSQIFKPSIDVTNQACTGGQGDQVACTTIKLWSQWQGNPAQEMNYLTAYTDGAPYEEWCADFVSYAFQQAGFPFNNGNSNGWDENIASNIQYQGFTIHQAGSYIPQPGDVAFFDYPGGHVEIVVVGGKNPTFIYGDSDTIDPRINNGAMEANDITSRQNLGSVQYYMSPNSST